MSALHDDAVVVDTHDDLLLLVSAQPRERQAAYFRTEWLPQLRDGGVDVQVLPIFVRDEHRPDGGMRWTLKIIEAAWNVAAGNPDDVAVCLDAVDVDVALAAGKIALILALEGCESVQTDLELFIALHRAGIRIASLTHFGRTMFADGSALDGVGAPLTPLGVEAVGLMEELGILLDISHLGAAGTDHVLEITRRPVIATHSSAYALRVHHRNLTDARLRGVAAAGGVVNVNFYVDFLAADSADWTMERVGDHLEHVADTAGINAVGLGPDFVRQVYSELWPACSDFVIDGVDVRSTIPGLEGPAGLPSVTAELQRRGWPEHDIRKVLGGNDLRVFRTDLGVPLAARERATAGAVR